MCSGKVLEASGLFIVDQEHPLETKEQGTVEVKRQKDVPNYKRAYSEYPGSLQNVSMTDQSHH